ncbi:MAG TPA: DUF167 domain-containing protein [Methylomirabilota bacterium]|jgi:uncharacterized protein (TIGR00251 family)|nr:DUF167 domain-containing protein [Methylomirabilota bacterium]
MAARPDAGLLRVRVQPRASRAGIAGWRPDGALGVRVTAAPVDGAANAAVGALLAEALGVRVSAVEIVRGATGRDKYVRVAGLTLDDVIRRLGG